EQRKNFQSVQRIPNAVLIYRTIFWWYCRYIYHKDAMVWCTDIRITILAPRFCIGKPKWFSVLLLFGKYIGTIKKNGLYWVNPFYSKQKISLRARNFDSERLKVNDKLGNPIIISTILVWRVRDTHKAAFDVDNYENFVRIQTDAAVRELASKYPYDNFADEGTDEDITLRSSMAEVNEALEQELEERHCTIAGIEVLESRIGYLAYANERIQSVKIDF
ncbi:unnamed protein product, partial [Pylaiella littoralis]